MKKYLLLLTVPTAKPHLQVFLSVFCWIVYFPKLIKVILKKAPGHFMKIGYRFVILGKKEN